VFLSQAAFHGLEDRLRASDVEEQKRNRTRDAETAAANGVDPREANDPYAPYPSHSAQPLEESPFTFGDSNQSSPALPLVANASPFQRADLYDEDYDEHKSFRSEEYDGRSRFTTHRDDSVSNFGTESYAPSRNMCQDADNKGLLDKDALAGEIQEGETAEVLKETSARRKWVALCWMHFLGSKLYGEILRPDEATRCSTGMARETGSQHAHLVYLCLRGVRHRGPR
jgi:chitin synthase